MTFVEKRFSSLTNASVVREFLLAVSLSGMPAALCLKHRLVNNFNSFISDSGTNMKKNSMFLYKNKLYNIQHHNLNLKTNLDCLLLFLSGTVLTYLVTIFTLIFLHQCNNEERSGF